MLCNAKRIQRVGFLAVVVLMWGSAGAHGQEQPGAPRVIAATKQDTAQQPLRAMQPTVSLAAGFVKKPYHANPHATVSLAPPKRDPLLQGAQVGPGASTGVAPSAPVPKKAVQVTIGKSFDGIGDGFQGPGGTFQVRNAPPDTNGAVGETQFVQWVNTDIAVFDKNTGAVTLGPIPGNTIWQGFGGNCEHNNDGDPIVQYDKIANRWVIAQFSVESGFSQCVAVSTTADATGTYHRYEFQYDDFDDYPKMGVWPDGYYISFNMFHGQNFVGSKVCAYERAAMLAGLPARQQCFQLSDQFFGLLPADLDGATSALVSTGGTPGSAAPPLGSPNFFLALGSSPNTLDLWNFHVDWNVTNNTTFGVGASHTPNQSIPVAAFTFACGGSGGSCISQPGNPKPEQLDTLGERLMYRLAYRKFADHESLLAIHSVDTGTAGSQTGIRWYELRSQATGGFSVFQAGTYAPGTDHRWMGSIAMDKVGNIVTGYSVSGAVFPGLRFAVRRPNDPLGTLTTEKLLFKGTGAQHCIVAAGGACPPGCSEPDGTCKLTRWGDYSSMSPDPADDCTLWFTSEYEKQTGSFNWKTRIAQLRVQSCHP
jgi:hypothetical protein